MDLGVWLSFITDIYIAFILKSIGKPYMHVKGIFCGQGRGDILISDFIIDMRIPNLVNQYNILW